MQDIEQRLLEALLRDAKQPIAEIDWDAVEREMIKRFPGKIDLELEGS